jgi:IS30 family transposase
MASRRRLSDLERLEIVRETRKGVSAQVLGKHYGVTPRTIQYTVKREKERRCDTGIRTASITVAMTPEEVRAFDVVISRHGIANRTEAVQQSELIEVW